MLSNMRTANPNQTATPWLWVLALTLALLASLGPPALAQMPPPPAPGGERPRNLLVEVRQGSAFSDQAVGGGVSSGPVVSGGVVISGGSGGFGGSGVGVNIGLGTIFGSQQRSNTSNSVATQIRVLDGGRATVQSATSQPLALLTRVGPNLVPSAVFVAAGSQIVLQPRLTASIGSPGAAPGTPIPPPWVEVTLSAQQAQFNPSIPGAVNTQGASTTLDLPLGEWVTVAESTEQADAGRSGVGVGTGGGVVGAEQRSRSGRFVVQIRVSVAP
jgi:hypothetical protein